MARGFYAPIIHDALCPDIAPVQCQDAEDEGNPIPDHQHNQEVLFGNLSQQITYATDKNWQFSVQIPFQYRKIGISYNLMDGTPYEPSYAGIHHRNESLSGIGDVNLDARYFWKQDNLVFGLSIGSSIPSGKIEEDPYLKGMLGEAHQHFQMGTGTFIPNLTGNLIYIKDNLGILGSIRADFSLYENKLYYAPGSSQTWDIGAWYRIHPKYLSLFQLRGLHEASDTWRDLTAPFSGRDALSIVWSNAIKTQPKQELIFRIEQLFYVHNRESSQIHEGEGFPLYTTYSLGYSFF